VQAHGYKIVEAVRTKKGTDLFFDETVRGRRSDRAK
jgi:hypothetical protein